MPPLGEPEPHGGLVAKVDGVMEEGGGKCKEVKIKSCESGTKEATGVDGCASVRGVVSVDLTVGE